MTTRYIDMRSPGDGTGYYHPKRLLLYIQTPAGLFDAQPLNVSWSDIIDLPSLPSIVITALPDVTIEISQQAIDAEHQRYTLQYQDNNVTTLLVEVDFSSTGAVQSIRNIGKHAIALTGDITLEESIDYTIENLIMTGTLTVTSGWIQLNNCAVKALQSTHADVEKAVCQAKNTLFDNLEVSGRLALEYCTLLNTLKTPALYASDSIFAGSWTLAADEVKCLVYSCVPSEVSYSDASHATTNTNKTPLFFNATFAEVGCGVLKGNTDHAILFGSEIGGEMGAYHHHSFYHTLEKIKEKLQDYLPIGMHVVFIVDPHLDQFVNQN
ncbi:MAG: hypothetical protein JKY13_00315 [Gammaproteobacteria bacterium]|nr:hypothetical protein [Gammaproteobacteria bacterium]